MVAITFGVISYKIILNSLALLTPIIVHADLEGAINKQISIAALVQLEGLNLPRPNVTGQATIPLKVLEGGNLFTITANLGKKSGDF